MSVTSPWKVEALEPVSFSDIMNEEYARTLQKHEVNICGDDPGGAAVPIDDVIPAKVMEEAITSPAKLLPEPTETLQPIGSPGSIVGIPPEVLEALKDEPDFKQLIDMESDAKIALMLQEQFNKEHDHYIKAVEKANNKNSKVQISLSKYRIVPADVADDSDDEQEVIAPEERRDWDRFETNEKEVKKINKRTGYSINENGVVKTKHDSDIAGRRNACKMMSFPPDISTGDAGSFDMKLSNAVFNQLRAHTKHTKKYNKASDRREQSETTMMGIDEPTKLILHKFINNQLLESVDGVISTGKEAVVLHGITDPGYTERELPPEVAIKIFSTSLNEFKQRDRYIRDDYRFKDRFSKQNARTVINMWAEKEFHNLNRLARIGIPCPETVALKKHVLIMSFLGRNLVPALKLKEAVLSDAEWSVAYEEVINIMFKMYNEARLVHADFSEYNILWHEGRCWVIDVAQAVEPIHPGAYEFLMRDCGNIVTFFSKKGVPDIPTKEELFFSITGLDPLTHNTQMLERIHMKGAPAHVINAVMTEDGEVPEQFKPLVYPFDVAWEKVDEMKKREDVHVDIIDALKELKYQEI